jgi:NADH-quinone oxidoreductase subunit A
MNGSIQFVVGVLLFAAVGIALGLGGMLFGKLLRPSRPGGLKDEIYECGEPTEGSAWVQFDLRFYVVALVFVIFDVEIALLFPWAVIYKDAIAQGLGDTAFWAMASFMFIVVMGFLYLWRFGYLDWVWTTLPNQPLESQPPIQEGSPNHAAD